MYEKAIKDENNWKNTLTPEVYHITREKGTEPAFAGKYWDFHGEGTYKCVCCGADLFDSETKFDSGSGWPSFCKPISEQSIEKDLDVSYGMVRTEVRCSKCSSHLGHVFEDGPRPTGLRYCINSAALKFVEKK